MTLTIRHSGTRRVLLTLPCDTTTPAAYLARVIRETAERVGVSVLALDYSVAR